MLITAVCARKSTDQQIADDQKSVARQVEHARLYAARKGWIVSDEYIYVDDGISGAEFAARPGFLRLMSALKPRAPFQVLIMSEESRLGRESIETAYALKQLVAAGVRVFFYLEDRERTLDSPTDKIMLSLTAFADELEREKARQRTHDAMSRKAKSGHVTGGRVFGYENVEVLSLTGERSHVERRVATDEATVVREIFALYASGLGVRTIAKRLNAAGRVCPRAQQGRPHGWAPSSVWAVLHRPLYRGEIVWNRTRKRNVWGATAPSKRTAAEWLHVEAPDLRIVDEALWAAVQERARTAKSLYLQANRGATFGRPTDPHESKYLLTGLPGVSSAAPACSCEAETTGASGPTFTRAVPSIGAGARSAQTAWRCAWNRPTRPSWPTSSSTSYTRRWCGARSPWPSTSSGRRRRPASRSANASPGSSARCKPRSRT